MANLTIYKASAGSGKTFQLTGEYLRLIFNPDNSFKHILAVTFTNKATAEMRDRILLELYNLSVGNPSGHAGLLIREYQLTSDQLKTRAGFLLKSILHNYSRFSVNTIDSFLQKIIKAFTREIGINNGFNIELNYRQVISDSVEQFFEQLNENEVVKNWLSAYSFSKLEEGHSWDIQKDLVDFSSASFNEAFHSFNAQQLNEFSNLESFELYRKNLNKVIGEFVVQLRNFGKQAEQLMQKHQLTIDDFLYKKSGVAGFLVGLKDKKAATIDNPSKRVLDAWNTSDFIEGWVSKTSDRKNAIQQVVDHSLHPLLKQIIFHFEEHASVFFTALAIRRNIDSFAVVTQVFKQVMTYCNEHNLFLLPLASPFLAKMIGNSDAPFIYEKTGEYLHHFMIDEFQDTSNMQWRNFFPLLENSLSQGYDSLVVGDVKQSIYRWRNSDWRLLDHQLKEEFGTFPVDEVNLPYNWRSHKQIVEFNNSVFSLAGKILGNELESIVPESMMSDDEKSVFSRIYESSPQMVPDVHQGTAGFIDIRFIDKGNHEAESEVEVLDRMIETIEKLGANGYQPRDIAILVRQNKEGAQVANRLMEHRTQFPEKEELFRFISNDSVFLGASGEVVLLVSLLQYLVNPTDEINKAQIVLYYYQRISGNEKADELLSKLDIRDNSAFLAMLPSEFVMRLSELRQLSLIEIIHQFLRIFIYTSSDRDSSTDQSIAFIHTFQDAVLDYTKAHGSDLSGFLNWWNDSGAKTPVNLSDEQNAIRIVTIHKAKGLEYRAVIVPFTNWKFDQRQKLMWCETPEPFSALSVVPVSYSSSLKDTMFSEFYYRERLMSMVDNLNLLYVAFTRAIETLVVFAPLSIKSNNLSTVAGLLFQIMASENQESLFHADWDSENLRFTKGTINVHKPEAGQSEKSSGAGLSLSDNFREKLRLKLHGEEFYSINNQHILETSKQGTLFHKIFEGIKTASQIEDSVLRLVHQGLIPLEESDILINQVKQLISHDRVTDWFSQKWEVKTEASYILPGGDVRRPDRILISKDEMIIVDYKFTQTQSQAHLEQMHNYVASIGMMQNKPVKGYLWYVWKQEIIEVI